MRRIIIIMTLLIMAGLLSAAINFVSSSDHIMIELNNAEELETENGYYYTTLAFPCIEVSLEVVSSELNTFDNAGNLISSSETTNDRIILDDTMVMRDLIMHRLRIEVESEIAGSRSILDNAVIRLQAEGEIQNITSVSSVFSPLYSHLVDNYETSYLRNLYEMPAKMLIISHQGLTNLNYFTDWKNERGIETEVVFKNDLGNSTTEIKAYIQNLYDTEEFPPDYLLLIGDVNGAFTLPAYYHSSENDVTDHPYTLLAGDDYFPEMIVGRWSIDQSDNMNTIISKILNYEKTPYMDYPEWFDNMLVVAGNYSDTPPPPTTPVTTSMWLAEKAADYGYDDITEIYYWPDAGFVIYPGTAEIKNAINAGAGIVAYRGWGNAWGWNYPYFHTENITQLNNGFYLPVMTSIVCNTGDFANPNVDPCFGELWLTAGNTTNPKGGVVFVGPSDLHTQTNFNNSIFSGFYQGLLEEGIHSFGTAVMRGKTELYQNFPINHGTGDLVEFYFYVYNILGDPSLNVWTRIPEEMNCELPDNIALGQNYLDIHVPEVENGMVTAKKNEEFLVFDYIRDHNATLYFDAASTGEMTVTITAVNHLPIIETIQIVDEAIDPELTDIQPQSEVLAGEQIDIDLTLTNQGTNTAEFIAQITELTGMAEIVTGNINFGELSSGASSSSTLTATIDEYCPSGYELSFILEFTGLDNTVKFPLIVNNITITPVAIDVDDTNGVLEPGETSDILITLANTGNLDVTGLNVQITSATTALTVNNGSYNLGDLVMGSQADAVFNVSAEANGFNGRDAGLYITMQDDAGRIYETSTTLTIGVVTNTDPTGPGLGGYFAYDSNDTGYSECPDYFWQEIDPNLEGSGEVIMMFDDQSNNIALPFDFTFYDVTYTDSITVSSNGWLSFVTTWQDYFRNWLIPGALGPYAQICAYWDDLIGPDEEEASMRICYYYDTTNNYFIIEWSNAVNRHDNVSPEVFQIVLYDPDEYPTSSGNGIIQVNYQNVNNPDNNGNYCTIGIENHTQERGVLYSYADLYPASASQLEGGLAIKYTTEPPDSFTGNGNSDIILPVPVLQANYPNPFNPVTTFSFSLPQSEHTELFVYNLKGEKVKTIVSRRLKAGDHSFIWQGTNEFNQPVSSGVYFYQLKTHGHTTTRKCVLMK